MRREPGQIEEQTFDVAIIGGGIIGAGIARDAALRGLKIVLLEKDDFGAGTTSRSSRLIHGGLRYLSHLDFGLVRQDMREREILLRIAPHLVKPLPFLFPIYRTSQRLSMSAGMLLYDILSYDKSLPSHRFLTRTKTMAAEPGLLATGMKGAYQFYDCQAAYPERLCLENVLDAAEHGGIALNHTKVTEVRRDGGRVTGLHVSDVLRGKQYGISARVTVNAAGHWMESLLPHGGEASHLLRRTKGTHLVTRKLSNRAVVFLAKRDGRLLFVIPWLGYSLVGTTDTDYDGDPDRVMAEETEIEYLATEVARVFPSLRREDIYYTYAGLRSLPFSGGRRASDVSRAHRTVDHEYTEHLKGIISVIGGKITGYRAIAEEVTDLVCRKLNVHKRSVTAERPLPGAGRAGPAEAVGVGLPEETADYLRSVYGSRSAAIADQSKREDIAKGALCAHSPAILAQVSQAVHEEGALTVSDFMLRRAMNGLAECRGRDAAEKVAAEMGRLLRWDGEERRRQVAEYMAEVQA